jgi:3-keto-L-gulonate-6-phosphate decarboxylase
MLKSKFSKEQIVAALKMVDSGAKVGEVCRKLGAASPWAISGSDSSAASAARVERSACGERRCAIAASAWSRRSSLKTASRANAC